MNYGIKINLDVIKDYYTINENGDIFSHFKPHDIVKLAYDTDKDGYYRTSLQCKDGKRRSYRVSRLVGLTFIHNENPNEFIVINHKDTNKKNNHVSNLEWTTVSYNTKHAYDNNLIQHGRIRKVKMTNQNTGEVTTFDSLKQCIKETGIDVGCLSRLCSGKLTTYRKGKFANILFEYAS